MSADDTIVIFQQGKNKFHVKRVMAAEDLFIDEYYKEKLNAIFNNTKRKYCSNILQAYKIAYQMNCEMPAEYGITHFVIPLNFKI